MDYIMIHFRKVIYNITQEHIFIPLLGVFLLLFFFFHALRIHLYCRWKLLFLQFLFLRNKTLRSGTSESVLKAQEWQHKH